MLPVILSTLQHFNVLFCVRVAHSPPLKIQKISTIFLYLSIALLMYTHNVVFTPTLKHKTQEYQPCKICTYKNIHYILLLKYLNNEIRIL
jgi:hypothetical protein